MRALYSAAQGMKSQQFNLDTISNNLSNVNTTGYKKMRTEFKDLLYEHIKRKEYKDNEGRPVPVEVGNGVSVGATYRNFEMGSIKETGNPYDLAIDGEGFFKIIDDNNRVFYTRDGNFKATVTDDGIKLVTSEGYHLQGSDGNINLGTDVKSASISLGGEIVVERSTGEKEELGNIDLFAFNNPAGLEAIGNNLYKETEASGVSDSENKEKLGTIRQGKLEMSNVQVVEEMVNMITAQRAYEINSKVIQTADQMTELANNLKR